MEHINYSIIIPHYNIPDLLMRCLKSIPVREDVQVIVVDDCSPGADLYLEKYPELSRPFLEFYSTPKGGSAGRARNVGLDHAKGKWLIFADADDFFSSNFERGFLDKNINRDEDIIYFNCQGVMSDDISKKSQRIDYIDAAFVKYAENGNEEVFRLGLTNPCGKCIKRNLVEKRNIRFDEVRYANDAYFSISCGCKANKIFVQNEVFYFATEREGSLAHKMGTKEGEAVIRAEVALRVQQMIQESGHKDFYFHSGFLITFIVLRDYKNFMKFYHNLDQYSISKWETIKDMCKKRKRYIPHYFFFAFVDLLC